MFHTNQEDNYTTKNDLKKILSLTRNNPNQTVFAVYEICESPKKYKKQVHYTLGELTLQWLYLKGSKRKDGKNSENKNADSIVKYDF